ncbi:PhzF family phenazine biosynthesis protein [Campylobacter curvus]|uniref:PhzF family phenazine biosynthesis protein n=1 Tax=Campylobacter curvus TaxID=200 RepID=UPI001B8BB386
MSEIDLCGHASLACAFVIMNEIDKNLQNLTFLTKSGELGVDKNGNLYELNFPAYSLKRVDVTPEMTQAIGAQPLEAYLGRDLLCIFEDERVIWELKPDMKGLERLSGLIFHASAKGTEFDCVSRSFAPKLGVAEDPVCGSGHCHIVPFWSKRLQKDDILAFQASARGGTLRCKMKGERVILGGRAVIFSVAELRI